MNKKENDDPKAKPEERSLDSLRSTATLAGSAHFARFGMTT
jgi:hypothetical protein